MTETVTFLCKCPRCGTNKGSLISTCTTLRQVQAMLIAFSQTPGCSTICSDPSRCFLSPSNVILQQCHALRAHSKCPTLQAWLETIQLIPNHQTTWTKTRTEQHVCSFVQHSDYCIGNKHLCIFMCQQSLGVKCFYIKGWVMWRK